MTVPVLPALVTWLALLLYLVLSINVSRMRRAHRIDAPATTGHPALERAFRVHQNTLEQLMLFLPALWLCALFLRPLWAAILGLIWVVGRVIYAWSYYRDPKSRGPGFLIAGIATILLMIGALVGIVLALGRTGL